LWKIYFTDWRYGGYQGHPFLLTSPSPNQVRCAWHLTWRWNRYKFFQGLTCCEVMRSCKPIKFNNTSRSIMCRAALVSECMVWCKQKNCHKVTIFRVMEIWCDLVDISKRLNDVNENCINIIHIKSYNIWTLEWVLANLCSKYCACIPQQEAACFIWGWQALWVFFL
jgi:hypothetical protein